MPTIDPIIIGTSPDDGLGDTLRIGGARINTSLSNLNVNAIHSSDTGVIVWAGFSIDGGGPGLGTTFTVAKGIGVIIDNEIIEVPDAPGDPGETNPGEVVVRWPERMAQSPLGIGTNNLGYILIDATGNITQQNTRPTSEQRRKKILLGFWTTANMSTLLSIQQTPDVVVSKYQSFVDMFKLIGLMKTGLIVTPNSGGNLSFDISSGGIIGTGVNYVAGGFDPNLKDLLSSAPAPFFRGLRTGVTDMSSVTAIDPGNFDDDGSLTAISGPNATSTNQRVFQITDKNVVVLYGQEKYDSLTEAVQAASTETFVVPQNILDQGVLIAVISVTKEAFSLILNAKILTTSLLGGVGFGGSGITTATFANTYLNSTAKPQLQTNAAIGSVQYQQGSGDDADIVTEVLNGAGVSTFSVSGRGDVTVSGNTETAGLIVGRRIVTMDAETGLGLNETILGVRNITGLPISLVLDEGAKADGKVIIINDEIGNAGSLTITVSLSSGLIDGAGSQDITAAFGTMRLYSDGAGWSTW